MPRVLSDILGMQLSRGLVLALVECEKCVRWDMTKAGVGQTAGTAMIYLVLVLVELRPYVIYSALLI